MAVTELLTVTGALASPLSVSPIVEGRTEVDKLDPNNLPTDGSFGKTTDVAGGDADLVEFSEPILVGEVELADVMAVTELLTVTGAPASPLSVSPIVEGRTEVDKLDPNNLPTDGSFGKTTDVATSKELAAKVERKSAGSTTPWNGESVQRKRSNGLLRDQAVDLALIELLRI